MSSVDKTGELSFWEQVRAGNTADYHLGKWIFPDILNDSVGPTDWSYDDYDGSVELKGCPSDWEPSERMLKDFSDNRIILVYVSRANCVGDSYEGAALYAYKPDGWIRHQNGCGQRTVQLNRAQLWMQLQRTARAELKDE